MTWLKWLFCPHDWKLARQEPIEWWCKREKQWLTDYTLLLYQCSKCTRFKKIKI